MPTDTTPDPRDMQRAPDEPEFLQPAPTQAAVPGAASDEAPAMDQRPPLPVEAQVRAVDLEDEEADPVGSDQPGLAERLKSDSELQRG